MVSEKRLIDANALLNKAITVSAKRAGLNLGYYQWSDEIIAVRVSDIYAAPTVDAVEVVRCKDCKWRNTRGCPYMNLNAVARDDLDFCSDGERNEYGI